MVENNTRCFSLWSYLDAFETNIIKRSVWPLLRFKIKHRQVKFKHMCGFYEVKVNGHMVTRVGHFWPP